MRAYGALFLKNFQWFKETVESIPLIRLSNATFYQKYPTSAANFADSASSNPPLFQNISLEISASSSPQQNWAVVSPSSSTRSQFLHILRGQLFHFPPTSRTYPYLSFPELAKKDRRLRSPEHAIHYVGFHAERRPSSGEYLSARYESRVEATDFTVIQYLQGVTGLNESSERERPRDALLRDVVRRLDLERFLERPVGTLSNGQSRRARIARALLKGPELLLLDEPFIGLDPFATRQISEVLRALAEAAEPRILVSMRPQDEIPEWITHLLCAGDDARVEAAGPRHEVLETLRQKSIELSWPLSSTIIQRPSSIHIAETERTPVFWGHKADKEAVNFAQNLSRDGFLRNDTDIIEIGEPVVEMQGVKIKYGSNSVLGNWRKESKTGHSEGLWWTVRQGQRWGIFGANGSGKTTLLSLITSDHPQTYSAPVKIFGRPRLPSPGTPGISIFDIQSRMGHASPEIHSLFPKIISLRRTLESAWAETPIIVPALDENARQRVDACLEWFKQELSQTLTNDTRFQGRGNLEWANLTQFGELSFSAQRVALFLRAIIRNPDVVILDEAFSGMDELARDKCQLFLNYGEAVEFTRERSGGRGQSMCGAPSSSEVARRGAVVVPGLQGRQVLLCVSHSMFDIPGCVREWLCLPESGERPPRTGRFTGPVELDPSRWKAIWDMD